MRSDNARITAGHLARCEYVVAFGTAPMNVTVSAARAIGCAETDCAVPTKCCKPVCCSGFCGCCFCWLLPLPASVRPMRRSPPKFASRAESNEPVTGCGLIDKNIHAIYRKKIRFARIGSRGDNEPVLSVLALFL